LFFHVQNIDLHALTGWIPERVAIRRSSSSAEEQFNAEREFQRIHERFHKGHCLVTVATGELRDGEADRAGLVPTHAYAMLDVQLIQVAVMYTLHTHTHTHTSSSSSHVRLTKVDKCNLLTNTTWQCVLKYSFLKNNCLKVCRKLRPSFSNILSCYWMLVVFDDFESDCDVDIKSGGEWLVNGIVVNYVMFTPGSWILICCTKTIIFVCNIFTFCTLVWLFYCLDVKYCHISMYVIIFVIGSSTFPVEKPVEPFTVAWEFFRAGHSALDRQFEENSQLRSTYSSCCRQW